MFEDEKGHPDGPELRQRMLIRYPPDHTQLGVHDRLAPACLLTPTPSANCWQLLKAMSGQGSLRLLRTLVNIWAAPTAAIAHRWIAWLIRMVLIIVASILTFSEGVLAWSFEWGAKVLAIPPCGVYTARESAVVIIGGEDGE